MKSVIKILFLCGIIVFMAFSCEKNEDDSIPVEFKLRVLNEQGEESTTFNEGENIILSFLVINKSSETIFLEYFLPNENFFRVSQLNTLEGILDWGFPYIGILEINGGSEINTGDTLEIKYAWLETDNIPNETYLISGHKETSELPVGFYKTGFSSFFKINDIQIDEKHFEIKFTVK